MSKRLALVLMLILGSALPALGKGPGSATLEGPGIQDSIRLPDQTISRPSYEPLFTLIDLSGLWTLTRSPEAIPSADLGEPYTITWLPLGTPSGQDIVEYVYLDAPGGPLIHTPQQESLKGWGKGATGWFQAPAGSAETIEEIIVWSGQSRETPAWTLPVIAFLAVAGLGLWGRHNDGSGSDETLWKRLRRAGGDQLGQ